MAFSDWAWQRYAYWRGVEAEGLPDGAEPEDADEILELLANWKRLPMSPSGALSAAPVADIKHDWEAPLAAFFGQIAAGEVPEPAMLLTLLESWNRYIDAKGELSLEAAFFGPPKPRVGNYSGRHELESNEISNTMQLAWLILDDEGSTDGLAKRAAEKLSRHLGGKPDADSILRRYRRAVQYAVARAKSKND